MGTLEQKPREHPAMRRLVTAVQDWRVASRPQAREEAQNRYNEAAATLIGMGVTLFDLDPMDMLPDNLMPLVWQEAYAETFAETVGSEQGITAVS